MADQQSASAFIGLLVDEGVQECAFKESTFENDFILLAEFCEMEGPKPIFTIPSVFNSTFNLNTFAVRIMSVDCVSIMQTTDFTNFNVAGDIQVILTELSEGAVAYVHHFVLYDVCARGFVRPYCLAYVMKSQSELLSIYEKLSLMFSLVSELFHFGNALSFINDLMLRLDHLSHLKQVLGEKYCDIFVDEEMMTESQKNGITQKALDDAMTQLYLLINIFKQYVESNSFSDHRILFEQRYKETLDKLEASGLLSREEDEQMNGEGGDLGEVESANEATEECITFTARASHQVPSDVVSSILGKKYDKRLRNLAELCDTTNSVALDVLRYSLHFFTTKDVSLLNPFIVEASKAEKATKFIIGTNELPVLACVPNQLECCITSSPSQISSVRLFLRHFIDLHLQKITRVEECINGDEQDGGGLVEAGYQLIDDLSSSFLSLLKYTSISLPAVSAVNLNSMHSKVGSFVNIPSMQEANFPVTTATVRQQSGNSEDSSDSYKDALCYPESLASSNTSSNISHREGGEEMSSTSAHCNDMTYVSSDIIKDMLKSTKISLIKLRDRFSFLPHVMYSFFLGRPVIVIGKDSSMKSVSSFVYGIANMLPNNSVKPKRICPWMTTKLTLRDLGNFGIIGFSKSVPISLRMYVSVVDYDKDTFEGPVYCGDKLFRIFDPTRNFSEKAFRIFLLQCWSELISEAYSRFTIRYTHDLVQYSVYEGGEKASASKKCDKVIINYFVDTLRNQILNAFLDDESMVCLTTNNIKLDNKKSEVIPNTYRKKRLK